MCQHIVLPPATETRVLKQLSAQKRNPAVSCRRPSFNPPGYFISIAVTNQTAAICWYTFYRTAKPRTLL